MHKNPDGLAMDIWPWTTFVRQGVVSVVSTRPKSVRPWRSRQVQGLETAVYETARKYGLDLIVHKNPDGLAMDINAIVSN